MCVYLRTKLQISSVILTSFRQGGRDNFSPQSPTSKRMPEKPAQIKVKT